MVEPLVAVSGLMVGAGVLGYGLAGKGKWIIGIIVLIIIIV